ncbi:unnamed protein product [Microthlaspi erraticum]|uniref:Phorbol-ester/DAG-type domain-containing protein n=1 Tax=Microthlaspi erraticum TaxID=1685480 RepID=A0A6D2JJP7_9BRAS|nr:unnamed protein product [Microthlaspi erraticum]
MNLVGEFHKVEINGKPYLTYFFKKRIKKKKIPYLIFNNPRYPVLQPHSPNSSDQENSSDEANSSDQENSSDEANSSDQENSSDEANSSEQEKSSDESNSADEEATDSDDDLPLEPLFLCPSVRIQETSGSHETLFFDRWRVRTEGFSMFTTSPLFDNDSYGHHVFPLFWCNNKEAGPQGECSACSFQTPGTDYYFCVACDKRYHKECVESPVEIYYPCHLKHPLKLYLSEDRSNQYCLLCRGKADIMVYHCSRSDVYMHVVCAQKTIPIFIDHPKRHDHTLTLFPRQASLTCNICGLINKLHLTYVCRSICDFVAHSDCIFIPQTIRISRHHHRISFVSSLPLGGWSCGVCRREVDCDYGAYTCDVCRGYAVHTRCALRYDVWDGIELEGIPEEEDEDVDPFEMVADQVILYFSHGHPLSFETSRIFDENKLCQACALPIYEGHFYDCLECDFILHEACASAPRKKIYPLHPHPLKLETVHPQGFFYCRVCGRRSNGFFYRCSNGDCDYQVDLRCAMVSEPFNYHGHRHPLFLALDPKEKAMCNLCKSTSSYDRKVLNCLECDYIICFECATLPYKAMYKHHKDYLTFSHGNEVSESDWCELCEGQVAVGGNKEGFYKCNSCGVTLHVDCLLGEDPYLKPGVTIKPAGTEVWFRILRNISSSRPVCTTCTDRCQYRIYFQNEANVYCSLLCIIY